MEYSKESIERFKWRVSVNRKIEAALDRVWATISRPGNLEDCHPFCESNPVHEWPGVGARDAVHYYSGWIFERKITNWIDGKGYDLRIGRAEGRKSYVSWRITEEPGGICDLNITIYPHVLQDTPASLRWLPYKLYIQPQLRSYLESVVKGFEWFIATGEPVEKNQFGSHSWFSKKK